MPTLNCSSPRFTKFICQGATLACMLYMLSGCTMVGPNYTKPTVNEPQAWHEEENPTLSSRSAELAEWWTKLNDPTLTRLIETACKDNPSLHVAGLRIFEARARLAVLVGEQYPQSQRVQAGAGMVGGSKNSANSTPDADFRYGDLSVGFDAAWEMDVWGKYRRAVSSGVATLDSTVADYDNALVLLTAEVARTYMLLATLEKRLSIAKENVGIQRRSLQIAKVRFEGGDVTELDVAQARTLLANTQAAIPRFQAQISRTKNSLGILLGRLPKEVDELLVETISLPSLPKEVVVGIPAEMLRRRPDIRGAEQQLLAQSEKIGVAQADLYPHFSLVGSIGLRTSNSDLSATGYPGGSKFGDLLDSDSFEYFIGPSLSWDILNYGRIKNQVRIEDARFQQLTESYRDTILRAAEETDSAIISYLRSREEQKHLAESANAAARSVRLAMVQYEEGLDDYQRVLETQRTLVDQQDLLADNKGQVATNLIAIYKALGGGWESFADRSVVPDEILENMSSRTDWGSLLDDKNPATPKPNMSNEDPRYQPAW